MGGRVGAETVAKIAQLGERMTEDHKVRCSIHLLGAFFFSLSIHSAVFRSHPGGKALDFSFLFAE